MSFCFDFLEENGIDESDVIDSTYLKEDDYSNNANAYQQVIDTDCDFDLTSVPTTTVSSGIIDLRKAVLHYHSGIDKDRDLITGTYEGGYKVWECSIDLINFIMENKHMLSESRDINIIELGCGHGFPGIALLKLGYPRVLFSEFNKEVLIECTWPNIYANCIDRQQREQVQCVCGDWISLSRHLLNADKSSSNSGSCVFDVILSAETLYSLESCRKIFFMIEHHLAEKGTALLATKRFYFGVGGGTCELHNLVIAYNEKVSSNSRENNSSDDGHHRGLLQFEVVKEYVDGSSNIREIIMIKWQS